MITKLFTLMVFTFTVEIQCQRNIRGSRLLELYEPTAPVTANPERVRNSKLIMYGNPVIPDISTAKNNHEVEECMPLDKCASLDWLVQNLYTMPDMSASNIVDKIKSRICGFYGRIPKVFCPMEDDSSIEESELYDELDYDYEGNNGDFVDTNKNVTSEKVFVDDGIFHEARNDGEVYFTGGKEQNKNQAQNSSLKTKASLAYRDNGTIY